ncbi:glycosyltransferase [Chelativorans sp. J32]|uniref:glycosyltransferase family 2 protein n=1 Tax=Chelativorans sp. J32 TaxID=935840 RepID=UPI000480B058|nr:glycosyltransferase [Chelativorans sp. J32]
MLSFLTSLDAASFAAMFWFLIFFEGPRYLIANLTAGFARPEPLRIAAGPRKALSVSIVLPCHNGAEGIAKTVASLREQTWPKLQIVLVDDGSTDNTPRVAQELQRRGQIDVVISTGLRGGKSAALNLGSHYCTGEIIIAADVDTTFDRDAIEALLVPFIDPGVGAVGGNIGVRNSAGSILATMQAIEYAIGISLGRRVSVMLSILPVVSGAFAAFRREALASVGGWDAGPGEDADLTLKLRRAGWKLDFAPHAWALTDAPATMQGLIQQRLRWEGDLARLHLRKFLMLLSPLASRLSLRDIVSTFDILIFSIALPFAFVVYVLWLLAAYGPFAIPVLLAAGLIYALVGVLTFVVTLAISRNSSFLRLLPYTFGYGVYCAYVLNPIRVWAFVQELGFDRSYRSTFVPTKVLSQMWRF